jgi:hypothetical protein
MRTRFAPALAVLLVLAVAPRPVLAEEDGTDTETGTDAGTDTAPSGPACGGDPYIYTI